MFKCERVYVLDSELDSYLCERCVPEEHDPLKWAHHRRVDGLRCQNCRDFLDPEIGRTELSSWRPVSDLEGALRRLARLVRTTKVKLAPKPAPQAFDINNIPKPTGVRDGNL